MRVERSVAFVATVVVVLGCDARVPTADVVPQPSALAAEYYECDPPDNIICDLHPLDQSRAIIAQQAIDDIGLFVEDPGDAAACNTLKGLAQAKLNSGGMRYWTNPVNMNVDGDHHFDSGESHFRDGHLGDPGLQAHEAYHEYAGPGANEAEKAANESMASYYQELCG